MEVLNLSSHKAFCNLFRRLAWLLDFTKTPWFKANFCINSLFPTAYPMVLFITVFFKSRISVKLKIIGFFFVFLEIIAVSDIRPLIFSNNMKNKTKTGIELC